MKLDDIKDLNAYALGYCRHVLESASRQIESGVPAEAVCAYITDMTGHLDEVEVEKARRAAEVTP